MADYPESLGKIIKEAAALHCPDDYDKATEWAWRQWSKQPESAEWMQSLAKDAIRGKIADAHHLTMVSMRKAAGEYDARPKVSAISHATAKVERQLWLDTYSIAGNRLGDILGAELPALAKAEQAKADGSAFNAKLCLRLSEVVENEKTVRDCVSESRIIHLVRELQPRRRTKKRREKAAA